MLVVPPAATCKKLGGQPAVARVLGCSGFSCYITRGAIRMARPLEEFSPDSDPQSQAERTGWMACCPPPKTLSTVLAPSRPV